MFLGPSETDLNLNFSFLSKFFVIVVREKWLLRSKTRQRKDVTDPKLVRENWLPIQNSSEKSCYRSKISQRKVVTDTKQVREKLLPILASSVQSGHLIVLIHYRLFQFQIWTIMALIAMGYRMWIVMPTMDMKVTVKMRRLTTIAGIAVRK